jgi:hypothetical protein
VRLAYLAKAVSKRDLILDCGEDVFEADDMGPVGGCLKVVWKGQILRGGYA